MNRTFPVNQTLTGRPCWISKVTFRISLLFVFTCIDAFFLFIVIYGLSHGSTVALLGGAVGFFFGLSTLSELLGFLLGLSVLVGAFTPWLGGLIFDLTDSYLFAIGLMAIFFAIAGALSLIIKAKAQQDRTFLQKPESS